VEGKQVEPFRVSLDKCRLELRAGVRLPASASSQERLAYRDVASATNRLTLIAAIVPAHAVTTHTLFCLKTPLDLDHQHVLCALMNSFVANYLIRMRVATHVTVSLVSRLPVPVVRRANAEFDRLLRLARALAAASRPAESMAEYAELQAVTASLYGLSTAEYEHILRTFPLIDGGVKATSLALLSRLY
jgi:hypothetical protein